MGLEELSRRRHGATAPNQKWGVDTPTSGPARGGCTWPW